MIRKRVCFWERLARELGYNILTWGIDWLHCKVNNNVSVTIERKRFDPDLFLVGVKIMTGETKGKFEKYYYDRRENLKENIEELIKEREEDIKLREATKRSS